MARVPDPLLRAAGDGQAFDLEVITQSIDYRQKMIDVIRDEVNELWGARLRVLDARRRAQYNGHEPQPMGTHPAFEGGG